MSSIMAFKLSNIFQKRAAEPNQSGLISPNQWFVDAFNSIFGGMSQSGMTVNAKSVASIAAVKKCVGLICNGMVNLNVKVYSEINGIKQVEPTYSASLLLNEPNFFQTKSEWVEWMTLCVVLKGNGYSIIERDKYFKPTAIVAILPENVQVFIKEGRLIYQINTANGVKDYEAYDVIHFKDKCLNDPFVGMSAIAYHAETFGVALAATNGQATTYKNGVLKFFIKVQQALTGQQLGDLKTSLDDVINNKANSLAVPNGVGVERISMTPAEAEYIASKKFSSEEIANIFNVPINLVVGGSNGSASAEQDWQQLYSNTLCNYAIKFEEEMKRKLIPEKDKGRYYFKFNFNSLLRASASDRAEFYNKGINNGWMSPNEARSLEDRNSYEGGDQKFVNANLIPSELMPKWIEGKIKQLESSANKNNNPNGNNQN